MANKQLTVKVRLNTSQAERSINNLVNKINRMNNQLNRSSGGKNLETSLNRSQTVMSRIGDKARQWLNNQKNILSTTRSTNSVLSSVWSRLKGIAATYLGIMGTKAVINTTDDLIGAQNRLNYVNAQQLGTAAYNDDGSFSAATLNATQDAIDKMYVSSQKARTSYKQMMSNVSKTMTLAGDAFDNNIDNAIRFQEIMAEAYTVGGATAQEQSASMYQLTQALGAGILAGDELRSVREGAPLAYQAIEKFAQGIYDTETSLKELASQGKITSEIVVAAIMNEGEALDKAFAQTGQTFGQTLDQIKNTAMYAFQPVMEKLKEALNEAVNNGMVQKFEDFFTRVAKAVLIAFELISRAVDWIADNWSWLQYIVFGVITAVIAYLGILAAEAIATAIATFAVFLASNPFVIWIVGIALVVAALVWLLQTCEDGCDFIVQLALIVAQAIIGVLAIVLAVYLATGVVMLSMPALIALLVIGVIALLLAVFVKFTGEIIGGILGAWEVIKAVVNWIDQGWSNMCNNMKAWFWNAIADMLEGCEWLLNGVNKIREALGKDAISVEGIRAKAESYESKVIDNNLDISAAWDTGYSKGYAIGEGIQDKINGFGEKAKAFTASPFGGGNGSLLDGIGSKLGLDFSGMGSFPTQGVGTPSTDYDKLLDGIKDDTGKMAKSAELTQEDLEYLRRIADMEWKKEYTTASITINMDNQNTINNQGDLDGWVVSLRDMLEEEISMVANGVYA